MSYMPKNPKPLEDLEIYELFVALYPDKFGGQEEDDELWDKVLAFADEVTMEEGGDNPVKDLLARIVYLAPVMRSPLSNNRCHALGRPEGPGWLAVLQRDAEPPAAGDPK